MPLTPNRITRLREFGLSEYAARAYLALLDLGVAEARDVSTLSKVPQAKIYHVLEQLHEKGLVVILPEFPKKYAPVPFPEYLDRLHEEHTRAADAIGRDREVLAEMFRVMGDTEVGNRGFFTVIRGRRNVVAKIQELVTQARSDLFIVGTTGFTSRHAGLLPDLEDAARRGVRLRALIPLTPETVPKLDRIGAIVDVRSRDLEEGEQSSRVALIIADGARAFLINFLPDDDNLYTGKDVGVFTDQEAMVAALDALVEPHWSRATTLAARREEMTTGRLPEFTRVCTTQVEIIEAFRGAMGRGVKELIAIDPRPASSPSEIGLAVLDELRDAGAIVRSILNVADTASGRALAEAISRAPGSEIRHLSPRLASRFWSIDDREAFFALTLPEGGEGMLVVHTSNASVVRSLRHQFQEAWERALPLPERLRELEVFPHIQPREIGIGRLFDDVPDSIFVADPAGRIVLWNPEAVLAFGYAVPEALRLSVLDVLPEADLSFRQALAGLDVDLQKMPALRRGGERFEVEATMRLATEAQTGRAFVIGILRDLSPRRPRKRLDIAPGAAERIATAGKPTL